MYLRKAIISDLEWIFQALEELRTPVVYPYENFKNYFQKVISDNICQILIFCNENDRIGMVTLNKFYMPRYLGVGYEMEEFVIHKNYRRNGYSYKMIDAVKEFISNDPEVRKLVIKSNGKDSLQVYAKALNQTDLTTFQIYLNKI